MSCNYEHVVSFAIHARGIQKVHVRGTGYTPQGRPTRHSEEFSVNLSNYEHVVSFAIHARGIKRFMLGGQCWNKGVSQVTY